ncbi:MAG: cytochrome oxidase small assembly protein [Rhodocyclaceae bacterium]|nr:cytochrome oxidase small assembly protein [Rhodocyclaceae bacterium]MCB1891036.1 cytochrome oxidase small assembly protein [Rhodocyclaceae bacterium]MCO5097592.1 cytochrome oxidase small assembly protein [Rhodocyclaceae bacterium]MCW5597103.1 cytochrome oxidase small assembly protein [Rhodocyclaceae bacterium]MCZ7655369.1 cytochrome oxidase small assembly protein [Rhodocyclaceae bacterium]
MNPRQASGSRRTALIMASIAVALFVGFILRYWLFK